MLLPDIGEVVTPIDDPCQFDPAWRASVAGYLFQVGLKTENDFKTLARTGCITVVSMKEARPKRKAKGRIKVAREERSVPVHPFDAHPEYRGFVLDKWIVDYVGMCNDMVDGTPPPDGRVPMHLARRWYEEPDKLAAMKKRIEPLLLTEADMEVVTLDLTGLASMLPVFECYERMYFNCRGDDWKLNPSSQLLQRMATPYGPLRTYCRKWEGVDSDGRIIGDGRPIADESDVWKAIALSMGYEALMYVWKWDGRAHGMKDRSLERMMELSWKVAVSKMFTDLYNGDIKHEDAARVLAAYTSQAKHISDSRSGASGEESTVTKVLMSILYQTSPRMVTMDAAEEKSRNEEIRSRIESQLAIANQAVEDKGSKVNSEVMDAQIANAIG